MTSNTPSGTPAHRRIVALLTLARLPLAVVFALLVTLFDISSLGVVFAGLALLLSIEMTDLYDGKLARRWGVASEFGATLDPYADSVSRLIVYWALAVCGIATLALPLVMAIRDVTVAYCRISMVRNNRTVAAKASGKIKAVVQGVGAHLLIAGPIYQSFTGTWTAAAISWIVLLVTVWSAGQYIQGAAFTPPSSSDEN